MKITVRKQIEKGNPRWCLDYTPEGGKRTRRFFKDRVACESAGNELRLMQKRGGEAWLALSTVERADLITGYERIRALDMTLGQIIDQWEAGKSRNGNGAHKAPTLREARAKWIQNLEDCKRREKHIKNCATWSARFIKGREEMLVDEITLEDVKTWLSPFKDVTWNSYRDLVRAFFNFCHQHKMIPEMFCDSARLPKRHIDFVTPTILTVEQTERALLYVRDKGQDLLAYFTLATFCGIRPEEIDKMDWSMIDLEREIIMIPATVSKVRRPRQIHLHKTALAWLNKAAGRGCPLGSELAARGLKMAGLKKHLGFKHWPHDVLRHSFGSYYSELTHDLAKTALEMGNSPEIILRNYRSLVRPDDCKAFWNLTPDTLKGKACQ